MKGTVKFFKKTEGWGFITPNDQNSRDVFVHHTGILMDGYRLLDRGDVVEFEAMDSYRGPIAYDVVLIRHGDPEPNNGRG